MSKRFILMIPLAESLPSPWRWEPTGPRWVLLNSTRARSDTGSPRERRAPAPAFGSVRVMRLLYLLRPRCARRFFGGSASAFRSTAQLLRFLRTARPRAGRDDATDRPAQLRRTARRIAAR